MSDELYVVRCSVVGDEPYSDAMPRVDAEMLADYYNNNQDEDYCLGDHAVELAEPANAPSD